MGFNASVRDSEAPLLVAGGPPAAVGVTLCNELEAAAAGCRGLLVVVVIVERGFAGRACSREVISTALNQYVSGLVCCAAILVIMHAYVQYWDTLFWEGVGCPNLVTTHPGLGMRLEPCKFC